MGYDIPPLTGNALRPAEDKPARARTRRAKLGPAIADADLREKAKRALSDVLDHGDDRDRVRAAAAILATIEAFVAPKRKPDWYDAGEVGGQPAPAALPSAPDAEFEGVVERDGKPDNVVPLRPGE